MAQSSAFPVTTSLKLAALLLALAGRAGAQDRRDTPGLKLDPGARTASCDALLFTPGGSSLLAAGDDKVVRVWPVGKDTIHQSAARTLRWRIHREQRGGIYAVALSPDGKSIAVGGYGARTGEVDVIDRATGAIKHAMSKPVSPDPTWSLAWSPDGRYVVLGSGYGDIYRWEPASGQPHPVPFAGSKDKTANKVRLIAFRDRTHFLSVAQDGLIEERDVTRPDGKARVLGRFENKGLFRVALSPKGWLAATPDRVVGSGDKDDTELVEVINLRQLTAGKKSSKTIPFRNSAVTRMPTALAFDDSGDHLAVGTQDTNAAVDRLRLNHVTGGKVFVFRLNGGTAKLLTPKGLDAGYRVDNVAFRPNHPGQLATAGGPNHEVRLWDYARNDVLSTVRSPGSCLWQVALSTNNHYLAWQEKLNDNPKSPNDRGEGAWRVFNLDVSREHKIRSILPSAPKDFAPVKPIERLGDWRVERTLNGYVWYVVGPGGVRAELSEKTGLYLTPVNQIPRCYTFLEKTDQHPARLAVGHMWGVSLYELRPGKITFARMLVGHESEVMSVAPSRDGKLLVTCSRDQTIACWSLEHWPHQRELGAAFGPSKGNTITVRQVDPGSPGWECGLTDGDEVVLIASIRRDRKGGWVFDPEKRGRGEKGAYAFKPGKQQTGLVPITMPNPDMVSRAEALKLLAAAEPAREYIFIWRHKGKEQQKATTVRQRPLWRFFPTRRAEGGSWILWRWRDFYYDTNSPEPDRLVGWHVNPPQDQPTGRPEFHPLSRFSSTQAPGQKGVVQRKGFHDPARVWKTVKEPFQNPRKVMFPDIEPPSVNVSVAQRPEKGANPRLDKPLRLRVTVRPRGSGPGQKITRVTLWLNDYDYQEKAPAINENGGTAEVEIPLARLRRGVNEVTVTSFNAEGGRGEDDAVFEFSDKTRAKPTLYALCVGISDYSRQRVRNLPFAKHDAIALADVFKQHKASGLFGDSKVELIRDDEATTSAILSRLRKLAAKAGPDDLFVLFLSGHGDAKNTGGVYVPGSFYYVSADADVQSGKGLQADLIHNELRALRCRKLILLDACHSGAIVSDPVTSINRDGAKFLIFSACKPHQESAEPDQEAIKKVKDIDPEVKKLRHGLFTEGVLTALGRPESIGKGGRRTPVRANEMATTIEQVVGRLLRKLRADPNGQTPVFEPPRLPADLELLCKP
jgi:WD40 repeat protein